jgi:hypothetical protein
VPQGQLYEALRSFIGFAGQPALPPEHILQGWQNRMALPAGVNDYAVISILSTRQHGTPVEMFEAPDPDPAAPGILTVAGLLEIIAQVDFCAEDDTARQRAECLAVAARSSLGVDFLSQYGFSPLYADDPRDISFVGDARQFVRRWMVTLHLCRVGAGGLAVEVSWFDRAAVSRLENVDIHHPGRGPGPQGPGANGPSKR